MDSSGRDLINDIRTIYARRDLSKQIAAARVLYLDGDKRKVRSWLQVCDNSNVPLEGVKYGLDARIAFDGGGVKP